MITGAIDLGIWTLLFFIIGMYKPQWPLFFIKNPSRFIIVIVTTILVMITGTLYGEGLRREKMEKATKQPISDSSVPVPVPVPVPVAPEKPVTK